MENSNNNLQTTEPKSNKSTIIAAIVLILLALGLVYSIINKPKPNPLSQIPSSDNLVEEELTNLTAEQRASLEEKVKTYQDQIKNFNSQTSADDKLKGYMDLAFTYNQLGQYSDAIKQLDKIVGDYQDSAKLWSLYAIIYDDMHDKNKAIEASRTAVKLDDTNPRYWFAYFKTDTNSSSEQLLSLYEEALTKTDKDINIIKNYAEYLASIGNKEQAIAQWEQAKVADPEYADQYQAEIDKLK